MLFLLLVLPFVYPKATPIAIANPSKAIVSAEFGKVTVTSAVDAGPIKVTAFVPLSVSSLDKILPAAAELPVITGAVKSFIGKCLSSCLSQQ